ncbi:MAG: hypothetical protein Q4G28_07995 [Neisseria sp.]|nr:hypothetical protein [Neisseria sp.]
MSEKWLLAALMLHIGLLLPYAFQLVWLGWCRQHRSRRACKPATHMTAWEDELVGEPSPALLRHAGSPPLA